MKNLLLGVLLSFISMAAQASSFGILGCKSQADRPGRQFEGQIQFSQQPGDLFVGIISGNLMISGSTGQALESTSLSGKIVSFAAGELFAVPSMNLRGVNQGSSVAVNANASEEANLPSQITVNGVVYNSVCQIVDIR